MEGTSNGKRKKDATTSEAEIIADLKGQCHANERRPFKGPDSPLPGKKYNTTVPARFFESCPIRSLFMETLRAVAGRTTTCPPELVGSQPAPVFRRRDVGSFAGNLVGSAVGMTGQRKTPPHCSVRLFA